MNSECHRANILSSKYSRTGIVAIKDTGSYGGYAWVQLFAD